MEANIPVTTPATAQAQPAPTMQPIPLMSQAPLMPQQQAQQAPTFYLPPKKGGRKGGNKKYTTVEEAKAAKEFSQRKTRLRGELKLIDHKCTDFHVIDTPDYSRIKDPNLVAFMKNEYAKGVKCVVCDKPLVQGDVCVPTNNETLRRKINDVKKNKNKEKLTKELAKVDNDKDKLKKEKQVKRMLAGMRCWKLHTFDSSLSKNGKRTCICCGHVLDGKDIGIDWNLNANKPNNAALNGNLSRNYIHFLTQLGAEGDVLTRYNNWYKRYLKNLQSGVVYTVDSADEVVSEELQALQVSQTVPEESVADPDEEQEEEDEEEQDEEECIDPNQPEISEKGKEKPAN